MSGPIDLVAIQGPFGPTYSANLLIMVLILLFLTVPVVLLLLDVLRGRKEPNKPKRRQAALLSPTVHRNIRGQDALPASKVMELVPADEIDTNFLNDRPYQIIAHVPPLLHVKGPVEHRGYLQIGANTIIEGDIHVAGSLALGPGAEVFGDLDIEGELYLAPAARVAGHARVHGDAFLERWAQLGSLNTKSQLHLGRGAQIDHDVCAERVSYDLQIAELERQRAPTREPDDEADEAIRHAYEAGKAAAQQTRAPTTERWRGSSHMQAKDIHEG